MNASTLTDSLGFIGSTWSKLRGAWNAFEKSKRRLILVLGALILIVAVFSVWMLNMTSYGVLYTNLSAREAGEILAQLKVMKVDAKPDGSDTILVPQDQIDTVRMEMAASGLPKNELDLNILEKGTGFGVTEDDKEVYRRYQLQQDLQNAIKTFDGVMDARVSLIIPKESVFLIEDQKTESAAAVLLTMGIGAELSAGNVKAIAELVLHSVPNLKRESISIIDSNMNVLNTQSDTAETLAQDHQALQQQVGDHLQKQIMSLLQPVFGVGKVLAEVNVALDFDNSTVESIRFTPAEGSSEGVIANIDSIREVTNNAADGASGVPGASANGTAVTISELLPAIEPSELFNESIQEKKTVEQYINTNPELVANILRSWLAEESR